MSNPHRVWSACCSTASDPRASQTRAFSPKRCVKARTFSVPPISLTCPEHRTSSTSLQTPARWHLKYDQTPNKKPGREKKKNTHTRISDLVCVHVLKRMDLIKTLHSSSRSESCQSLRGVGMDQGRSRDPRGPFSTQDLSPVAHIRLVQLWLLDAQS